MLHMEESTLEEYVGRVLAITHECLKLLLVLLHNQWLQLNMLLMPLRLHV
ncbi:hypothetical protein LINPERHAP1_LOCUS15925 [Linum perenne]